MSIIEKILEKVKDNAIQESGRPHTFGVYPASEIGGCGRQLQYANLGIERELYSPELYLLFQDGHTHHNAVRHLLHGTGKLTHVEMAISKTYKHRGQRFTITGHLDCIHDGLILDIKSISTFMFKQLPKKFPNMYERYITQLIIYMDIMKKDKAAFLFKDKNSSEMCVIKIKYDPDYMLAILDKVATIHLGIKKDVLIDRPYSASSYECRTCPYRRKCLNMPMEQKRWGDRRVWTVPLTSHNRPQTKIPGPLVSILRDSLKLVRNDPRKPRDKDAGK